MLITEYEPNMRSAQNLVKLLIPVRSKDMRSTIPKLAQNNDCDVSNRLRIRRNNCSKICFKRVAKDRKVRKRIEQYGKGWKRIEDL